MPNKCWFSSPDEILKTVSSSETSTTISQSTRSHTPEDLHLLWATQYPSPIQRRYTAYEPTMPSSTNWSLLRQLYFCKENSFKVWSADLSGWRNVSSCDQQSHQFYGLARQHSLGLVTSVLLSFILTAMTFYGSTSAATGCWKHASSSINSHFMYQTFYFA
jgi:hypothetical protein